MSLDFGKGRGRVVAGGLVGRARKNASIEGISDAVADVVDDDDDDAFFYDDDDDDDDDDLFESSFPKEARLRARRKHSSTAFCILPS